MSWINLGTLAGDSEEVFQQLWPEDRALSQPVFDADSSFTRGKKPLEGEMRRPEILLRALSPLLVVYRMCNETVTQSK